MGDVFNCEDKKDSTQTTPTQTAKITNRDEENTDEFLKGFNEDREEREARVRKAYAERVTGEKNAKKEKRVDAFLEGFNEGSGYGIEEKEPRNATFKDITINSAKKGYFNDRYGEELFKQMMRQKF